MLFADRVEAGRRLAVRLEHLKTTRPVVLALPRGGVPVGYEIARRLAVPLNLVLVRKIGAPGREELAIGAIAEGDPPELVTDEDLAGWLALPEDYLETAKQAALREIERRRQSYLPGQAPVEIAGRTVIVVDDGIATGATMLAALRATRRRKPSRLVLAVPVAPAGTLERLRKEVDEAVCLEIPDDFYAVGQFYRAFPQLQDEEVIALLNQARAFSSSPN